MRIEKWMLRDMYLAEELQDQVQRYMEIPHCKRGQCRFVLQEHWRGVSVHRDLRLQMGDHLNGWTNVGQPPTAGTMEPITTKSQAEDAFGRMRDEWKSLNPKRTGLGWRAETKCFSTVCDEWLLDLGPDNLPFLKGSLDEGTTISDLARQPLAWLKVSGLVKPGEVGATRENTGFFNIIEEGTYTWGTQKPYFHEYFLHGTKGLLKDIRVVYRAIQVPALDPVTKKAIKGKYELMWRGMIPKDQDPYAVSSRARKEGWVPPVGTLPIPEYWIEEHAKEFKEWELWVDEQQGKEKAELSEGGRFILKKHEWQGQKVVRDVPKNEWYLWFTGLGNSKPRVFGPMEGDPAFEAPLAAPANKTFNEDGTAPMRYMKFEGIIPPGKPFNGNRRLPVTVTIEDEGSYSSDGKEATKTEEYDLTFHGDSLKGRWKLKQEETGSDFWTVSRMSFSRLSQAEFVLQRHILDYKRDPSIHWDIRFRIPGEKDLSEFNIYQDPRKLIEGEDSLAVFKDQVPMRWFTTYGDNPIGLLESWVELIARGKATIIERSEGFWSFELESKEISGFFIGKQKADHWTVGRRQEAARTKSLYKEMDPELFKRLPSVEYHPGWAKERTDRGYTGFQDFRGISRPRLPDEKSLKEERLAGSHAQMLYEELEEIVRASGKKFSKFESYYFPRGEHTLLPRCKNCQFYLPESRTCRIVDEKPDKRFLGNFPKAKDPVIEEEAYCRLYVIPELMHDDHLIEMMLTLARTPRAYSDPLVIEGNDHIRVDFYDEKEFIRTGELDQGYRDALQIGDVPDGAKLIIGTYAFPGRSRHVKVQGAILPKPAFSLEEAIAWAKTHKRMWDSKDAESIRDNMAEGPPYQTDQQGMVHPPVKAKPDRTGTSVETEITPLVGPAESSSEGDTSRRGPEYEAWKQRRTYTKPAPVDPAPGDDYQGQLQ